MKQFLTAVLILCSVAASTVWADCDYAGRRFPTGTKIGDRTCQPDGTWR
jgi:hypothetical protein